MRYVKMLETTTSPFWSLCLKWGSGQLLLPQKSTQSHKEKAVWFPSKRNTHSSHPESYSTPNKHKIHNSKISGSHEISQVKSLLHTIYKPFSLQDNIKTDILSWQRSFQQWGSLKPGRIFNGKMLQNTLTVVRIWSQFRLELRLAWCSQTLHLLPAADLQFLRCYGIEKICNSSWLQNITIRKKMWSTS